jgi:hypothetical protein
VVVASANDMHRRKARSNAKALLGMNILASMISLYQFLLISHSILH